MTASSTSGCIANISPLQLRRRLSPSIGQKTSGSARGLALAVSAITSTSNMRMGQAPLRKGIAGFVSDPNEAAATQNANCIRTPRLVRPPANWVSKQHWCLRWFASYSEDRAGKE